MTYPAGHRFLTVCKMTQQPSSINSTEIKQLPIHEWVAVILLIGLLFGLTLITFFFNDNTMPQATGTPHYLLEQDFEVFVEGAVENPGAYKVKRGASIQDVVDQAKPLPEANLKILKLSKKVRNGQIIKIKETRKPRKIQKNKLSKKRKQKGSSGKEKATVP